MKLKKNMEMLVKIFEITFNPKLLHFYLILSFNFSKISGEHISLPKKKVFSWGSHSYFWKYWPSLLIKQARMSFLPNREMQQILNANRRITCLWQVMASGSMPVPGPLQVWSVRKWKSSTIRFTKVWAEWGQKFKQVRASL